MKHGSSTLEVGRTHESLFLLFILEILERRMKSSIQPRLWRDYIEVSIPFIDLSAYLLSSHFSQLILTHSYGFQLLAQLDREILLFQVGTHVRCLQNSIFPH